MTAPRPSIYSKTRMGKRLSKVMMVRDLSCREVSARVGISAATVSRIARGGVPDVESYLRVAVWLERQAKEAGDE